MTVLQFLQQNNVYSFQTGRPLMIRRFVAWKRWRR
jgi:hypothetical protein